MTCVPLFGLKYMSVKTLSRTRAFELHFGYHIFIVLTKVNI